MAKQLSKSAITEILGNIDLSASVAKILGLEKVTGLDTTLYRNGKKMNQYDTIVKIAKAMSKKPSDILEDKEIVTA